ncbi:MAG: hypothetical protein IJ386_03190 [Clostridia bacterium]|nr:hypothetical protein [Clostridia bacterium]
MANNKIDRFLDAVYGAAEAKSAKMIREIDRAGEISLREYRAERRRSADAQRRRETQRAAKLSAETTAHDDLRIRRELLARRSAIADEVFAEVRLHVEEYKKTPDYKASLLRDAKKIVGILAGCTDPVILMSPADEGMASEIAEISGLSVKADLSVVIGGLKGVSAQLECDCTLDARLESARKEFEMESGLSVV